MKKAIIKWAIKKILEEFTLDKIIDLVLKLLSAMALKTKTKKDDEIVLDIKNAWQEMKEKKTDEQIVNSIEV